MKKVFSALFYLITSDCTENSIFDVFQRIYNSHIHPDYMLSRLYTMFYIIHRSPGDCYLDQLLNVDFESELIAHIFRGSSPVDEDQDSLESPQSHPPSKQDAAPGTPTDEDTKDEISPPTSPASFILSSSTATRRRI